LILLELKFILFTTYLKLFNILFKNAK
jgi:hypothetical protein